jgi:hypothetical protein
MTFQHHNWSGWPGAWCMDCGCDDPREIALAEGDFIENKNGDIIAVVTAEQMTCPEPGSNRHDPYAACAALEKHSTPTAART